MPTDYGGPVPQDEWSARSADAIGRRIGERRRGLGLSVQQLSDAAAELGVTIKRPVLSNLEHGRRHTITEAEIRVLARVLGVPPILLTFPVGAEDEVEILPGEIVSTWDAARWFTGEAPYPGDDRRRWSQTQNAAEMYRAHDLHVDAWLSALAVLNDELSGRAELAESRRRVAERDLQELRGDMRAAGLHPPRLTDELVGLTQVLNEQGGDTDGSTESAADPSR